MPIKNKSSALMLYTRKNVGKVVSPIVAVVLALTISGIILFALGINPRLAISALVQGAFGSITGVGEIMVKMTPLLLTALSFAIADRSGLVNIGAEGQLIIGGTAAAVVGIFITGIPAWLHIALSVVAGMVAGGLYGMLAGFLKVKFGADEMIVTIMLNYIATYFSNWMATSAIKEPNGSIPQSSMILETARFPRIIPGTRANIGIFIAILCLLFYYIFLWKTKAGFNARVVGLNRDAAHYSGVNTKKMTLLVMFLAGAFAGICGATEILGLQNRLYKDFSPGYGFDGIAVALLGGNTPIGILISSVMFGILRAGSNMMQMMAQVPSAMIRIIQGLIIIFVVASNFTKDIQKKRAIKLEAKGDK